jgi:hypothetical protein
MEGIAGVGREIVESRAFSTTEYLYRLFFAFVGIGIGIGIECSN